MDKIKELIKKAQEGDQNAQSKIVEENMGLVWSVVKKFTGRGYEPDDLFQIGAIGLIKCIQKFDLNYDVKFSTYAVPMIIGEIKRFLRDDGLIKISRPIKEIASKAKYAKEEYLQKHGVAPTINQLAIAMDVDIEDLIVAMDATKEVESLYATIYQGDGGPIYLIDKLIKVTNDENKIVDILALKEIIKNLKPKEREIIMLRYFSEKTQTEIAKQVGVSQVQVSRIEKKILENIRKELSG
ncbi:MAG: RNA polymerase sporulation sigma factor SigF [Defluviitaleaceae bacterium]|nr:RNA polymerase sporulation sigma factor SigF [Defluviitaleaceae bacterium]